jgi:PBP1b-binding outer membrane lipoprotein LpoB
MVDLMKKMVIFSALVIVVLLASCAAAQSAEEAQVNTVTIENPYAPQAGDEALNQDSTIVENVRWDEANQTLTISGSLSTPCNQLRVTVTQNNEQIDFTVYSVSEKEILCAQMLEPFEAAFKIESFDPQLFRIFINGQEMQL